MSKIRILAIPPDTHGVGKYRILDPYKFIGDHYSDEFHIDIALSVENNDNFFKNYDIVVFHSFIHQTTHEENISRIKWLKSQGIKTVMDIDDHWSPDHRHPMYFHIKENELPKKKVDMMKESDYGYDLRGSITEVNPQTNERKTRPIQPMETVWYKYEQIFTDNYKTVDEDYKSYLMNFSPTPEIDVSDKKYRRVWTQPIGRYGANYNLFDVSLAPVIPSEFNSYKSQLKIIESGFHKKPIIASETMPYTIDLKNAYKEGKLLDDGNALLVHENKNHKLWAKYMKLLIENPNMVEDLGNKLYETVKDKYSLVTVSKNRTEFFKSII